MPKTTDIEKYAALMKQIKLRTEVIQLFLSGQCDAHYMPTTVETIGLQFRKLFELIAFSSLAANREQYSAAYENFATHWRAGKLLENLERINPDFYPKPVLEIPSAQPGVVNNLKDRGRDYLTQGELIVAHRKCGALMHAENPFGKRIDYEYFEKNYPRWNTKIINLLNIHKVHLLGDTGFWLFHMQEEGKGNEVSWYRFEQCGR
jgi:hypothetical protein